MMGQREKGGDCVRMRGTSEAELPAVTPCLGHLNKATINYSLKTVGEI